MTLRYRDPFSVLFRNWDTFPSTSVPPAVPPAQDGGARSLPVDVVRGDDEITIRASVPGVDPDSIEVTVDRRVLTIAGSTGDKGDSEEFLLRERSSGSFSRSLRLPDYVDFDGAKTSYERGVVTISLPKSEKDRSRRLQIEVSKN